MEDDQQQQFRLRWNKHESTLVALLNKLFENGTLVDCTLAAEGQSLKAHKVVLSACSPYFESLLSQNYHDKHPIFIMTDIKFQELNALMDYMYKGEVNISQDQLEVFLKAAKSLQIKDLSDVKKEDGEACMPPPAPAKSPPPTAALPGVQDPTIEKRRVNRNVEDSREGSQSPGPRRRKKIRHRSADIHDACTSSASHHSNSTPIQNIPIALPPSSSSTHSELLLEPKSEYVEEMNDKSIEDVTVDDGDAVSNLEISNNGAGSSRGNMGAGSSQSFAGWHMSNQNQDEILLAAQKAVGTHRGIQEIHLCDNCGGFYPKSRWNFHKNCDCRVVLPQLGCLIKSCSYKTNIKANLKKHMIQKHKMVSKP